MAEDQELPFPKSYKKVFWDIVKTILKITVTGFLLYLVFRERDFNELKQIFLACDPLLLLLAVACFALSVIIASSRLLSFFKSIHLKLDFRFNLRLYMLGMFYNLFLPGGIGGDGYKIYLLNKRYRLPGKKVFMALLFDRLSGLWAIGLITVALIIFIPKIDVHLTIPGSIFLVGTFIYYFIARKYFREFTRYFFEAHAKAILVQSLQVITVMLILSAHHFEGKFAPYLLTFLVSSLAAIFPFTVGGLGAREYVFTFAAGIFSMDPTIAVFVSLMFYLVSAVVSASGIYYVFRTSRLEAGLTPPVEN
ncbi:MAG: lysylphosphatidylglycerol synthase transmembrane domain-containing protein [Sphingobacteriaceae bacterium]